jgi:hypothetical protein
MILAIAETIRAIRKLTQSSRGWLIRQMWSKLQHPQQTKNVKTCDA